MGIDEIPPQRRTVWAAVQLTTYIGRFHDYSHPNAAVDQVKSGVYMLIGLLWRALLPHLNRLF